MPHNEVKNSRATCPLYVGQTSAADTAAQVLIMRQNLVSTVKWILQLLAAVMMLLNYERRVSKEIPPSKPKVVFKRFVFDVNTRTANYENAVSRSFN
jgi:hypothetical protein